jgi:glycosyltransferase involved in cell wall biosynthesis
MTKVCMLSCVHDALDNRIFHREARTLRAAGYDVTVVGVHDRDEVRDGIDVRALPSVPRWRRPAVWLRLLRLACEVDADVYHFHDPELLLVAPLLRRRGARTIYDVHEANAEFVRVKDYLPRRLREPLARAVAWGEPRLAARHDALVVADASIATTFDHLPLPVVTMWNFPGERFLERAAADGPATRSERRVLYLGGVERNRGARLMMSAFALVREQLPDAQLTVVGRFTPPELEAETRATAARLGIDDAVTITGSVPYGDVAEHLALASIGWIPWQPVAKNRRNVPTKLFEYLAWGLPVVSSDLESIRPFVTATGGGVLVDATDPVAHATAIVGLLGDDERAHGMAESGRTSVRGSYHWRAIEDRLVELYRQLAPPDTAG